MTVIEVLALAGWAVAAFGVVGWDRYWKASREVRRLSGIVDPAREVCMCGHDAIYHHRNGLGCGVGRCACCESSPVVRSAVARRRVHMTRIDVQDE